MTNRLYLASPLEIEEWEIVEHLEQYTLYDEFAARIEKATSLVEQGKAYWIEYCSEEEGWSPAAVETVANVRYRANNIRRSSERYDLHLADCIRSSLGGVPSESNKDAQLVAALAMDSACRAIETLAHWFSDFEKDLCKTRRWLMALDDEEDAMPLCRKDWLSREVEVRESTAEYLAMATQYLLEAEGCSIGRARRTRPFSSHMTARRAGKSSAASRKDALRERNRRICAAAQLMMANGITDGIAARIERTAVAEREPGGEKLSRRQIENILRGCGVI